MNNKPDPEQNHEQQETSVSGDVVGRDKIIYGDEIHGDKVGRDKIVYEVAANAPPAPGDPPFQGLRFFDVDDADRFFGREILTAELVEYLRNHAFLAVIGASGSGKSSLVRAGVVAALQGGKPLANGARRPLGSTYWPVFIFAPGIHPLESLATIVTGSDAEAAAILARMGEESDALRQHLQARIAQASAKHVLMLVDQFEEIFTLCRDQEERRVFINNILCTVGLNGERTTSGNANVEANPARLILTLRADFYAQCAEFEALRKALGVYQRYIGSMNQKELRRAIEAPAQQGNWLFEPGLVDLMLEDIEDEPGALPLLSHALLETWKRRSGRTMTLAGYQAAGRVQGAIAKTADAVYNGLNQQQQLLAKNIFFRLVEVGDEIAPTRRHVRESELVPQDQHPDEVGKVLDILSNARLVVISGSVDKQAESAVIQSAQVELTHESLIREWPKLASWLQEHHEWLIIRNDLSDAAQRWQDLSKDPDALYRGHLLEQATAALQDDAFSLSAQETEFYEASLAAVQQQQQQQKRQRNIRWAFRLIIAIGTSTLLLFILMISPVVVDWQRVSSLDVALAGDLHTLALDPHNEQILFVLDEGAGVLVSQNGGHSWNRLLSIAVAVREIEVVDGIIYAITDSGITTSRDSAHSWQMMDRKILESISALAVDPTDANHLFATDGTSVVESQNGGTSWNQINSPVDENGSLTAIASTGATLIAVEDRSRVWFYDETGWHGMEPDPPFPSPVVDVTAVGTKGRFLLAMAEDGVADAHVSSNLWFDLPAQLTGKVTAVAGDTYGYYVALSDVGDETVNLFCRRIWPWTNINWWRTRLGWQVPCRDS